MSYTVTVKKSNRLWPPLRPQRFYWVAVNDGNHRTVAQSSEMYTNAADALDAAQGFFGAVVTFADLPAT